MTPGRLIAIGDVHGCVHALDAVLESIGPTSDDRIVFLGDLIAMFKSKGWQPIDAEEAFRDPVFTAKPKVLPAGESIVWSLAKGKRAIAKSLRYPAEDGEYEMARMNKLGL